MPGANNRGSSTKRGIDPSHEVKVRWVERNLAFDRFLDLHKYIMMDLETISMSRGQYNSAYVNEASTLLVAVTNFECIVALVIIARILSYLKPLSTYLQTRALDLGKAFDGIELIKSSLREVQSDEMWYDGCAGGTKGQY